MVNNVDLMLLSHVNNIQYKIQGNYRVVERWQEGRDGITDGSKVSKCIISGGVEESRR